MKGAVGKLMIHAVIRQLVIYVVVLLSIVTIALLPLAITPNVVNYQLVWDISWSVYSEEWKNWWIRLFSLEGLGTTSVGTTVEQSVLFYVKRSLNIIIPALLISLCIGMLLGVGIYRWLGQKTPSITRKILSTILYSLPDFFIFIGLQVILLQLYTNGWSFLDLYGHESWYNAILPVFALCIFPISYLAKVVMEELGRESKQDYTRTARAKGTKERWVISRHMLRNTLRTITVHSVAVCSMILSSLPIIEMLSNYNGAGYHLMEAIARNESFLVIGYLLAFFFIMVVMTWFISAVYYLLMKEWIIPSFRSSTYHVERGGEIHVE